MTTRVVSFGDYEFDNGVISFSDNFSDTVPRVERLPGLSGGYSQYGAAAPPGEIGNVQYQHMLIAATPEEMREKVDALRALTGTGMQRLTVEPYPGATPRFCTATIQNIQITERVRDRTQRQQPVSINWNVPDPRWYTDRSDAPAWGHFGWGDGSLWGGALPAVLVESGDTLSIDNIGAAPTRARFSIMTYSDQTVTNPALQRIVRGQVVDEVRYNAVLSANKTLLVDCRAMSVRLNSLGAYDEHFSVLRPERWFELQPGTNLIRVLFGTPGDAAYIRTSHLDAWY